MSLSKDGIKVPLPAATVGLMRLNDTSLVDHALTNDSGVFVFKKQPSSGKYFLKVRSLSHDDFLQEIAFDPQHPSLGVFNVRQKFTTLEEVIVKARQKPPNIDTLEFNTADMQMGKYDNVATVLNQLGLQIGPDGSIRMNGEKIKDFMVNNKKVQNIADIAELVNAGLLGKVQIINEKSDAAKRSGVDDGDRHKSINLVLKKDVNTGKAEAKIGTSNAYLGSGAYMAFKKDYNFMTTFSASNMGSGAVRPTSVGAALYSSGMLGDGAQDDPMESMNSAGIPTVINFASLYSTTWGPRRNMASAGYNVISTTNNPITSQTTIQILPEHVYNQKQHSYSDTRQMSHNAQADMAINGKRSAWAFAFRGNIGKNTDDQTSGTTTAFNDTLVNKSDRITSSSSTNKDMSSSIAWRLQPSEGKSRMVALTADFRNAGTKSDNALYAANQFFQPDGALSSADTTDQKRHNTSKNTAVNVRAHYGASLFKLIRWSLSYGISADRSETVQDAFDKVNGHYDRPVAALSNDLETDINKHQVLLGLMTIYKKMHIMGMLSYENNKIVQTDHYRLTTLEQNYNQFSPRLMIEIPLGKPKDAEKPAPSKKPMPRMPNSTALSISYTGLSRQPSLQQLQPIIDNSDPLRVNMGNPDLLPSYMHSFSIDYRNLQFHQLHVGGKINLSTADISTRIFTDSVGRQVSQPVNVSGGTSANLNISFGEKIKSINTDIRLTTQNSFNKNYNMIGSQENSNNIYSSATTVSLMKFERDRFNALFNVGVNYNRTESSVSKEVLDYWSQNIGAQVSFFFFKTFPLEVTSSLQYMARQKTNDFDQNTQIVLLNASVNKRVLHDRIILSGGVNNILNQNNGIKQSTQLNEMTQTITNTRGRIGYLGMTWKLDQKSKPI